MGARRRRFSAGLTTAALLAAIGAPAWVSAQSGERSITIYNIHTKETVTALYKRGGRFEQAGLDKINRVMRDHRRDESTRMDPELIDLLWQMHAELGSREPIHLISGFRSKASNEMLRKTVGGQASESRHILGKAADVHFPDVPIKRLRYSALVHEKGGVGYYPTSALPFVHVDTDRVRSWPRLPRQELALLFPSGQSRHAPADGGPITRDDVRAAQVRHRDLAQQVAQFHAERMGVKAPVAVAEAIPAPRPELQRVAALPQPAPVPAPNLVAPPQPVPRLQAAALPPRPAAPPLAPTQGDRQRLAQLASLAAIPPQLIVGPAPARRPAKPSDMASLTGDTPPPVPAEALSPATPPEATTGIEPAQRVAAIDAAASPDDTSAEPGRFGWGAWVAAAAYDDEHPEELSYRPFPIGPYLTDTATEPLMSELVAPDMARTFEILDQPDDVPSLRFRPGVMTAGLLWSQQFTGPAVAANNLRPAETEGLLIPTSLASRSVRTSPR